MRVALTGILLVFCGIIFALGADPRSRVSMRIVGGSVLGGILLIFVGALYWIWLE